MSARDGIPAPIAEASRAADSELVTTRIDCRTTVLRKREALRAHRSQIAPDWPLLRVPEDMALKYADEWFQLVITRKPRPERETDLFEGITAEEPVAAG